MRHDLDLASTQCMDRWNEGNCDMFPIDTVGSSLCEAEKNCLTE